MTAAKIRPRFNHWIPRRLGVRGIVLYPYVLFSEAREQVPLDVLTHEMIHVRQVRSRGWLGFYSRYLLEYALYRLKRRTHSEAYLGISFEREAYAGQFSVALNEDEKHEIGIT